MEIAEKFETVHTALKNLFGRKHYAIERDIIQLLHDRQRRGVLSTYDEIQASVKVIEAFLSESEMELTASTGSLALLSFARRMEREIIDNKEKLEAAERLAAIGQTVGMVGHDLRNPLQTIIGEVWLMRDELKKIPDDEQKK